MRCGSTSKMDNETLRYGAVAAMIVYLVFLIYNNRNLFK